MKITVLNFILSGLILFPMRITASEANQCIVERAEKAKFDGDIKEIADCVLKKNCKVEDRSKLCPWAFKARASLDDGITLSNQLKTTVEAICDQCESLAIISCGKNLEQANGKFNYLVKVFVIESANAKPLVFGYKDPNENINDLNLKRNLDFLLTRDKDYSNDLNNLTTELSRLAKGVNTAEILSDNIKESARIVLTFRKKWSGFLRDLEQLSEIVRKIEEYSDDWQVRINSLTTDEGCGSFQTTLNEGISQSGRFNEVVGSISDKINNIRAEERLDLIFRYSETSIKLNYVQAISSNLVALEQSLGNVLRLEAKVILSNQWFFKLSLGGLVGGLHTDYFQYEKPLKMLSKLYAEGIDYLKAIESVAGVSQSVKDAAIRKQNERNNVIMKDIIWLEEKGWKGQLSSQISSAKRWISLSQNQGLLCKKSFERFLTLSSSVNDDYAKFENILEPLYLQAAQLCEASR